MVYSPDRKPLSEVTVRELEEMHRKAAQKVVFSLGDITEELRYREQRRISENLKMIVTIQAVFAGLAVFVAAIVAAINLSEVFG